MMECPDLAVPAAVMHHIVHVESSANPFAIGVVGGRLVRQPKNLDEAVATARMLEAKGYNFSLGVAQVNRVNFGKYGLDSHEKAFDPCANLSAGSRILAGCHASAGGDWGKAFSCYYSGNFSKGFQDGYVQKVFDSINRGITVADSARAAAIPLLTSGTGAAALARATRGPDRIALRSAMPTAIANPGAATPMPAMSPVAALPVAPLMASPTASPGVFVPQVRGVGEAAQARPAPTAERPDQADLRKPDPDHAFVF